MAEPDKKPAQPWAGIKAPEAKGYYSALGLSFDCEPNGAPPEHTIFMLAPLPCLALWPSAQTNVPPRLSRWPRRHPEKVQAAGSALPP